MKWTILNTIIKEDGSLQVEFKHENVPIFYHNDINNDIYTYRLSGIVEGWFALVDEKTMIPIPNQIPRNLKLSGLKKQISVNANANTKANAVINVNSTDIHETMEIKMQNFTGWSINKGQKLVCLNIIWRDIEIENLELESKIEIDEQKDTFFIIDTDSTESVENNDSAEGDAGGASHLKKSLVNAKQQILDDSNDNSLVTPIQKVEKLRYHIKKVQTIGCDERNEQVEIIIWNDKKVKKLKIFFV